MAKNLGELEKKLLAAQERVNQGGGEWEARRAAYAELLVLEREVAAAKGEPYAAPLDFPVQWDYGAPLPHLICQDSKALLSFYVSTRDPNWDGTTIRVVNPTDNVIETLALVEFQRCVSAKLGSPNDEVFHGHPLSGKGLDGYAAQTVENSPWIAELEAINSVHSQYSPEFWRKLKHYVFWFHDTTFECLAASYTVEVFHESMTDMLNRMIKRLWE